MTVKMCQQPPTATLRRLIDTGVSWILAVPFLISATTHLVTPYYFLGSCYAAGLFGPRVGGAAAMVLPVRQVLVAVWLIGAVYTDADHCVAFAMLGSFAVVQTIAWMRGLHIGCGCFGPRYETTIGLSSVARVYGLLVASGLRNGIRLCGFL